MRTGKAVTTSSGATTNYSYVYENGMLQKMTRGNRILEFSYDANGTPVSIKYRSSATATPIYYYYGINSRGDVVSLYNSNGTIAAKYEYDAYGKLIGVTTSAGIAITGETSIANLNPLRYRSYVYDNETGFYYLQTRYYDPTTCRFINEDIYYDTGQGFNGYNMFAYCNNNPVTHSDLTGEMCTREASGCGLSGYCGSFSAWGGGGGYYTPYNPQRINLSDVIIPTVTILITYQGVKELQQEKFYIKKLERAAINTNIDKSNPPSDDHSYWEADLANNKLFVGKPLSVPEASLRVSQGKSLMCKNEKAARYILFINRYYNYVGPETSRGEGFYPHFHPTRNHTGYKSIHIWYYT